MIELINTKIEGFGSITKKLKYRFNTPGLTIISGPNGVGKTTIFNAMFWSLTGQTLKDKNIQTWNEIQPKDYQGTKVITTFKKGTSVYIVHRFENYKGKAADGAAGKSRILIYKDGTEIISADKRDAQATLTKILGYSSDLFKSSILFGQKMKRLIEADGPTKKKIFEEAFEVEFISKARSKAEKERTDLQAQFNKISVSLKITKEKYTNAKNLYRDARENEKLHKVRRLDILRQARERIKLLEKELSDTGGVQFTTKLKSVTDELAELGNVSVEFDQLDKEIFVTQNYLDERRMAWERTTREAEEAKFSTTDTSPKNCKACGQKLKSDGRQHVIEKAKIKLHQCKLELKQIDKQINDTILGLEQKKVRLLALRKSKDRYNILSISKINLEREIRSAEKAKEHIQYKIDTEREYIAKERAKKVDKKSLKYKADKKELKAKLIPLKAEYKELNTQVNLYNWLINDPLGNAGLKAYIFNQMVGLINHRLLHYTENLGFKIDLGIDMQSARKDMYVEVERFGAKRAYESLSGGQRQLIDVFLAFATHDVVTLEKGINVLLFDEVFESLDTTNIELISQYIHEKSREKSIHLITHRDDFDQSNVNKVNIEMDEHGNTHLVP